MKKLSIKILSAFLFVTLALPALAQTGPTTYRVDDFDDLVAITLYGADPKGVAFVGGDATRNDGYGSVFYYNGTSTLATNVYSVLRPTFLAGGAAGRWIMLSGQTFNQNAVATAASESTYAVHLLRNNSTNVFALGADNNNVYLQSWANYALHLNNTGNNTILNATAGNVGIGTTSPVAKFDTKSAVTGNYAASTQQVVARFFNSPADQISGVNSAFLSLQTTANAEGHNPIARIGVVGEAYASNLSSFVVATRDANGITERMRVTSTGNVGIGTASPAATLDVAGTLLVGTSPVGQAIYGIYSAAAELDFASIDANSSTNLTVTVAGAGTNSVATVSVAGGAQTGHIMLNAFVSATNTVTVRAANPTVAAIDPASTSYRVVVTQY